jgi:hypothetical protein
MPACCLTASQPATLPCPRRQQLRMLRRLTARAASALARECPAGAVHERDKHCPAGAVHEQDKHL